MSEDDLKKQVARERNRIKRLRQNGDDYETESNYNSRSYQGEPSSSWLPAILFAIVCLFAGKFITSKINSIPQNALGPTQINSDSKNATSVSPTPSPEEERISTDEQVKRALSQMNDTPTTPRPVSTGVSGQLIQLPGESEQGTEMVRVKGKWFKKSADNIYNVKGERIYFEKKKNRQ